MRIATSSSSSVCFSGLLSAVDVCSVVSDMTDVSSVMIEYDCESVVVGSAGESVGVGSSTVVVRDVRSVSVGDVNVDDASADDGLDGVLAVVASAVDLVVNGAGVDDIVDGASRNRTTSQSSGMLTKSDSGSESRDSTSVECHRCRFKLNANAFRENRLREL